MAPNELLWNSILRDGAELIQKWSLLEVDVEAISEAHLLPSVETSRFNSEWVLDLTTALFETCQDGLSGLLSESHGDKSLLDLLLFSLDFFERVCFSCFFEG